ncbi:MAG: signal peptidase II [Desulfobacteraceae bacterium]|jgi:signal peptidase II|nr:signal peptidase II [Desulfobacteraceae bacterium]
MKKAPNGGEPEPSPSKIGRLMVVAGLVLLLDQLAKAWILHHLPLYHSIPVLPGWFELTHVQNPGGAFGFLAGHHPGIRGAVFLFFSGLAAVLVLFFYFKTPKTHFMLAAGFALIFGGALGNLVDRLRFGKVVDFLDVHYGTYHWPAFNIADSAITVGIGIFLLHIVTGKLPD